MSLENSEQILVKIIQKLMNEEEAIEVIKSAYPGSIAKFNR